MSDADNGLLPLLLTSSATNSKVLSTRRKQDHDEK